MGVRTIATLLLLLPVGCATSRDAVLVPIASPAQPADRLLADLQSPSAVTRATAAWALAGTVAPDQTLRNALHTAYADPNEKVREAAAWALGHIETGPSPGLHDEPPRAVRITKPAYPREAYTQRIQGTVLVEILISASGAVVHAEIRRSIPALDAAALACVKQWLFNPARLNGRPVPTLARAPVGFRIT